MPPAIVDAALRHRAALLAREQAAMQAAAVRWLRVEAELNAKVEALALVMARDNVTTMGQLRRLERYRTLQAQIDDELRRYSGYIEGRITDGQRQMAAAALEHSAAMVDTVATEAGIQVPFNKLPRRVVDDMVGIAGDGSPLRAILEDASRGAGDALGQQLVNGIALGKGPLQVARDAMRLGLGQSFTRMQAIARTEQLRVYRTTTLESYQNSNVVTHYRRLSARDDRVCPACLMADGQIYPISHGFDEHVQGRCTMIPVLRNVAPIRYETGQEWFAQQPEATQRTILGRGRFEAWQDGRVSLDGMVQRVDDPVWGGSLVTTRVQDIGGTARVLRRVAPVAPKLPPGPATNRYVAFDSYHDANDWAEKAYASFDKSLTPQDTEVIDLYCGHGSRYREWNSALRTGGKLDGELQSATKSLDEIIDRAAPGRNIVTYRGSRNVFPKDYTELQKLVGTTITDKGYVSTSFNKGRAMDFGGGQDALMEIRIPKTAKAGYLNPSESEIVLPRNTKFKVIETRLDQDDPDEDAWPVIVLEVLG